MSIINSIANVRKPIGSGYARTSYFSKKHNLVIKKQQKFGKHSFDTCVPHMQSAHERRIFETMDEKYKEIFPIEEVILYKGEDVIIMRRCLPLDKMDIDSLKYNREFERTSPRTKKYWNLISSFLGVEDSCNSLLASFVKEFNLRDIRIGNIGVLDNHLVIFDAGISR